MPAWCLAVVKNQEMVIIKILICLIRECKLASRKYRSAIKNSNVSMHKNKFPSSFNSPVPLSYMKDFVIKALTMSFLFDYESFRLRVRISFIFPAKYLASIKDFVNPMFFKISRKLFFSQQREKTVWLSSWSCHIAFINSFVNRLEHSIS